MRVGIVGDIHGNYEGLKQAAERMAQPDLILFTGDGFRDICRLKEECPIPVEGVGGNCDIYTDYPTEVVLNLKGCKILLTHGHKYVVKNGLLNISMAGRSHGVNLVVFGHTHLPLSTDWHEIKLFNPGSISLDRSYRGPTFGMLTIHEKGFDLKIERL